MYYLPEIDLQDFLVLFSPILIPSCKSQSFCRYYCVLFAVKFSCFFDQSFSVGISISMPFARVCLLCRSVCLSFCLHTSHGFGSCLWLICPMERALAVDGIMHRVWFSPFWDNHVFGVRCALRLVIALCTDECHYMSRECTIAGDCGVH